MKSIDELKFLLDHRWNLSYVCVAGDKIYYAMSKYENQKITHFDLEQCIAFAFDIQTSLKSNED